MEGEEAKKTVAEYQELVKKQEEVIESTKEKKNKQISELQSEVGIEDCGGE